MDVNLKGGGAEHGTFGHMMGALPYGGGFDGSDGGIDGGDDQGEKGNLVSSSGDDGSMLNLWITNNTPAIELKSLIK